MKKGKTFGMEKMMNKKKEKKKRKYIPTKGMLNIRILAGMYLIYTAYQIVTNMEGVTGIEVFIFYLAAVLFAIIGVCFSIFASKALYKGAYAGGAMYDEEELGPTVTDTLSGKYKDEVEEVQAEEEQLNEELEE